MQLKVTVDGRSFILIAQEMQKLRPTHLVKDSQKVFSERQRYG